MSAHANRKTETLRYTIGFVLALILTLMAFAVVAFTDFSGLTKVLIIFGLAVVQIIVHFFYFLHIDLQKSHRDDLLLILFTGLIIFLMVAGSLWILFNLDTRMLMA